MKQNTIDILIFNRLASHGSVFLPNIGSLRCERIAATPAFDGNGFTAPRYVVEYIARPCGTSIIDLLITDRGIEESEATSLYEEWLSQISISDKNGSYYTISQVGRLEIYEGGTALFTADSTLLPFLNPYENPVSKLPDTSAIPEPVQAEEIPNEAQLPSCIPLPPPLPPQFQKQKPQGLSKSFWKTMTLALVFLLAFTVGIIIFGPSSLHRSNKTSAETSLSYTDTIELASSPQVPSIAPQDSSSAEADTLCSDSGKPYHIIAGSFQSKENAEKLMVKKKKEFDSVKLLYDPEKGLYMVSVYQFATHREARQQINRMPILYYPYSYWIYHEPTAAQ